MPARPCPYRPSRGGRGPVSRRGRRFVGVQNHRTARGEPWGMDGRISSSASIRRSLDSHRFRGSPPGQRCARRAVAPAYGPAASRIVGSRVGTPWRRRGRRRGTREGRREPGSGRFLRHTRLLDHIAGGVDLSCVPRSGGTHKTFAVLRRQGRRASARPLDPRSPVLRLRSSAPEEKNPMDGRQPSRECIDAQTGKLNLATRITCVHTRRTHRTQGLLEGESEGPMGGACRAPNWMPGAYWWRHGRSALLFGKRRRFSR